jgi:hypothetical protein
MELLGGCANTMRDEQLARVAKDWSLVVRASQVIPVYPLTEDLMPGDMFLVRMSIPQQHREYQRRGFLPMDMHLTRLHRLDYAESYLDSYGTKGKINTPYHWQFPPDGMAPAAVEPRAATGPGPQGSGSGPQPRRHTDPTLWSSAPRAAFPSYTFHVDSRGGIQVALPIQGVPVALSMMQTDKAFGSVTLSDAYTYGLPYDKLFESVRDWAKEPANRGLLKEIRSGVNKGNTWASVLEDATKFMMLDHNERTVYLRVVSRVYVVGSVTVALINARSGAAEAQVGAVRNIQLLNPALQVPKVPQDSSQSTTGNTEPKTTEATAAADLNADPSKAASNFQKALEAVNANLGGAMRLQWATARSVSLDEDFPRPLVIGYLGFDFPINADGSLGTPIATQHQLEGKSGPGRITEGNITSMEYSDTARPLRDRIERWLEQDYNTNVPKVTAWLKERHIEVPAAIWVNSDCALPSQLAAVIKDLKIPE